ncbi:hypothetical protein ACJLXB_003034 [Salmonella enterica subsp. enterica serovar Infantis]
MATISQVSNFYSDPVQKSQMSHFAASLPLGLSVIYKRELLLQTSTQQLTGRQVVKIFSFKSFPFIHILNLNIGSAIAIAYG